MENGHPSLLGVVVALDRGGRSGAPCASISAGCATSLRQPRSFASTIACARERTPSLSKIRVTWLRTVFSLMRSCLPISMLVRPCAIRASGNLTVNRVVLPPAEPGQRDDRAVALLDLGAPQRRAIERELLDVPFAHPAAALVVADEAERVREEADPVPPHRAHPVVLEIREPSIAMPAASMRRNESAGISTGTSSAAARSTSSRSSCPMACRA